MPSTRPALSPAVQWLLDGDPSIAWQTRRDILAQPARQWLPLRNRVAIEGWGQQFLAHRDPTGTWGGGVYSPRWTSTTYTLLTLRDMGLPRDNASCRDSIKIVLDTEIGPLADRQFPKRLGKLDLCISGMNLSLLCYFAVPDERTDSILQHLLGATMPDGGWNCKRRQHKSTHSSVHTTINILEALSDHLEFRPSSLDGALRTAIARAQEFLLQHHLFKSHRTGKVINEKFLLFAFPPRWHYDVLRALDYFRRTDAPRDARLADALELLRSTCNRDGRWHLETAIRGIQFFPMEKHNQPSRWNTLRALRVLRWWSRS